MGQFKLPVSLKPLTIERNGAKFWALWAVVHTNEHICFHRLRRLFRAEASLAPSTKIGCNSKTVARRAKRTTFWALWAVVHTNQHIYFDRLRRRFHAEASLAPSTEIGCNSKTVARRAKRTKFWALWAVVHSNEHYLLWPKFLPNSVFSKEKKPISETAGHRVKRSSIWAPWR